MEDNNLIEIPNFNYKFDKVKNEVLNTKTNKYIKNCLIDKKYYYVQLRKNDKRYTFHLDELVYFSHNPSLDINTLEIYHLDGDILNNNIENLQNGIIDKSLVDIKGYPKYKFNLNTNEVFNIKHKKYLINTLNNKGYYSIKLYINKKTHNTISLHRLVYQVNNPNEDISKLEIDHIDRDKSNNNIENLRVATSSQNCSNRATRIDNTSGYKNITKRGNSYRLEITKDKKKYCKSFNSLEEAILHRDMKLNELHEKFACIE